MYDYTYFYNHVTNTWTYIDKVFYCKKKEIYYIDMFYVNIFGTIIIETKAYTKTDFEILESDFFSIESVQKYETVNRSRKDELIFSIYKLRKNVNFKGNKDRLSDLVYNLLFKNFSYNGERIEVLNISSVNNNFMYVMYESIKYENNGYRRTISTLSDNIESFFTKYNIKNRIFDYYQYNGDKNTIYIVNSLYELEDLYKFGNSFQYISNKDNSWHSALIIRDLSSIENIYYFLDENSKVCNIEELFGEPLMLYSYK
jgi:hypothetical protein